MTLRQFLNLLFGNMLPTDYLVLTAIKTPAIKIKYFQNLDLAAEWAKEVDAQQYNAYFGLGLQNKDLGAKRMRGKAEDVIAVPGLWLDLDLEAGSHKKPSFKNPEDALAALAAIECEPTLTIHSGGGLHCYFLFERPWRLESKEAHVEFDAISSGFQRTVLSEAARFGASVDMTWDCTRVLRLPGTMNWKYDPPVPVTLHSYQEIAYSREQFERFKARALPPAAPTSGEYRNAIINGRVKVRDTPNGKLHAVMPEVLKAATQNDPRVLKAAMRQGNFQSDSEQDLSLASFLAHGQIDRLNIAEAMVWSREQVDTKARRVDYVQRTVARAHNGVASAVVEVEATPRERADRLKELSEVLGVTLTNVIEYTGTEHAYEVETEHGTVTLGSANALMSWWTFNAAVMQLEHRTLHPMKEEEWYHMLNLLLEVVEVKELREAGSEQSWMVGWLKDYLAQAMPPIPHSSKMDRPAPSSKPFAIVRENDLHIHMPSFKMWLGTKTRDEEKIKRGVFARIMRSVGLAPYDLTCNSTTFEAWRVPVALGAKILRRVPIETEAVLAEMKQEKEESGDDTPF